MIPQIRRMETLGMIDAIDHQEYHHPTAFSTITMLDPLLRPTTRVVRRRVLDIQLWRNLTSEQQTAAERIERGFKMICAGLGARCQNFNDAPGRSLSRSTEHLLLCYKSWTDECRRQRLPIDMALGILVQGRTIVSYAAEYRCRATRAKVIFTDLLDAYCKANRL